MSLNVSALIFSLITLTAAVPALAQSQTVGGFTGRASSCEAARLQAVAEKDRYCRNVRQNYTCGGFIENERVERGGRCAIRGSVVITKIRR